MAADNYSDLFPPVALIDPATQKRDFVRIEQNGHPDAHRDYEIAFLRAWKPTATAGDISRSGRFGAVLQIKAPAPEPAGIDIALSTMSRDVDTMDWLVLALDEAGEKILTSRRVDLKVQQLPDVLSEKTGRGGRLLRRSLVLRDGPRMWLTSAWALEPAYRKLANTLLFTLSSFGLLSPEGSAYAEPQDEYTTAEPVRLRFRYPASWTPASAPPKAPETYRVSIATIDQGHKAGSVLIQVWRGDTRPEAEILEAYCAALEGAGLRPARSGWRVSDRLVSGNPVMEAAIRGSDGATRLNLTAALARGTGVKALISLTGPDRSASADWWAIDKCAMDMVLDSLEFR